MAKLFKKGHEKDGQISWCIEFIVFAPDPTSKMPPPFHFETVNVSTGIDNVG